MAALCNMSDTFCRRTYNSEHSSLGVYTRKVVLLYSAQCLCRCRIAGYNHEVATKVKEFHYGLSRKLIYYIKRAWSVWCSCIVAEIQIIVLRHELPHLMKYCQTSVTRVKHSNRTWRFQKFHNARFLDVSFYFKASATRILMSSPLVLSTYGQASPSVFRTNA